MTLTVYSDAADGGINSTNATYSTARSGGTLGAFSAEASDPVGQRLLGGTYSVYEVFQAWDTSALGAGATVTACTISEYGSADNSATDFTVDVRLYDWGAAVTTADWIAGASLSANTLLAHFATSGWSTAGYNAFTDDAFPANVNKTGFTRVVAASSLTEAGTAPTGNEYVRLYQTDQAGTTQDPKLDITYTAAAPSAAPWYSNSWPYRVKVTVDHTKVSAADQSAFPVFVDLANLPAGFFANVKSDGGDVRITTTDGVTEVPREVVAISTGGSTGELHFKGDLSTTVDTDFYLYYGNATATEPAGNATYGSQAVWSGHKGVWHLTADPSGTNPTGTDATSVSNDINTTNLDTADLVTGKVGKGWGFNGTDEYGETESNESQINGASAATWSVWFQKLAGNGDYGRMLFHGSSGTDRYSLSLGGSGVGSTAGFLINCGNGADSYIYKDTVFSDATWYHLAAVYNGGGAANADRLKVYINGAVVTGGTYGGTIPATLASPTTKLQFGRQAAATCHFKGYLDEPRLATAARSAGWILTEYNNQNSPSTFYAVAAAEPMVKTINGLAIASVKTINGLAIASVKTVNGLA